MKPDQGQMGDVQAQIFEFIKKKSKETRAAVELAEIQSHFNYQSNLVVFQAIVDLYDAGKLHEPRMQQYLPREF